MNPDDYAEWLRTSQSAQSMSEQGERVFARLGCASCHSAGTGPSLVGIFGKIETLANGQKRLIDESFIRDVVIHPATVFETTSSFQMPTFQGQMNELELLQLIQYIKSLSLQTELRHDL
jgi:cytochrome c oxidase subunit 2